MGNVPMTTNVLGEDARESAFPCPETHSPSRQILLSPPSTSKFPMEPPLPPSPCSSLLFAASWRGAPCHVLRHRCLLSEDARGSAPRAKHRGNADVYGRPGHTAQVSTEHTRRRQ